MKFVADFHIHSKYSRATSPDMDIEHIDCWASKKGVQLVGTGDFTHHFWLSELKKHFKQVSFGIYKYGKTRFILTTEVNNFWPVGGRVKKVHNIIFAPSFDVVDLINNELTKYGSLISDGRPILQLDAGRLVDLVMNISSDCMVVPAHVWTPHFSVFGSNSGFCSLEEAYGDNAKYISAIETGLSSDPEMNRRLSKLDKITLISNSDAHSPSKIGREANVFDCGLDYKEIIAAIKSKDRNKFLYTIEFFPEEGKYYFDGHRNCNVCWHPDETKKNIGICPKCRRPVTVGVMNRIMQLADRGQDSPPELTIPFKKLVPLEEIISDAIDKSAGTVAVAVQYEKLIKAFGTEFAVLLDISHKVLESETLPRIADAIMMVRKGLVKIVPGYDGEYGKVKILDNGDDKLDQMGLF